MTQLPEDAQTFHRPPHLQSRLDAEPTKPTVLDPDGHSSPYRNRDRIDEDLTACTQVETGAVETQRKNGWRVPKGSGASRPPARTITPDRLATVSPG